jgi:hypothetical protein
MFTLSHHLIVQAAANRVGKFPFEGYSLLGDDIVIADDQVAQEYDNILKDLDVPISPSKTHVSKTTYEFAKRWIVDGVEVTPFPVAALVSVGVKYHLLFELLKQCQDRNLISTCLRGNPVELLDLWRIFGLVGRNARTHLKKFRVLTMLPKGNESVEERGIAAKAIASLLSIPLSCNFSLTKLSEILGGMAVAAYSFRMARTAEACMKKCVTWIDIFRKQTALNMNLGPDDQSELVDFWERTIPPIATLSRKAEQAIDSIGPTQMPDTTAIWDRVNLTKILVLPDAKGINPSRSSYLYAGAKATMVRDLEMTWKRHLLGLRPGDLVSREPRGRGS